MPETSNKVFENLNLEISLKEDYAKILEGLNNKKIFIDITIMPNNDSKPIFERLTEDTEEKIEKLTKKIVNLIIFIDENDKMNLSIKDVKGEILLISQFTLCADTRKGNRPSFVSAKNPKDANKIYEKIIESIRNENIIVEKGIFGADMKVELLNDGPVTILLDI